MPVKKYRRNAKILKLRDAGWSFGAIGLKESIDKKTVQVIYYREKTRTGGKIYDGKPKVKKRLHKLSTVC